jgi:hypothetical protein
VPSASPPSPTSGTLLGDPPIGRVDVSQELRLQALNAGSIAVEEAGEPIGYEAGGCAMGVSCQASQLAWGKKPG